MISKKVYTDVISLPASSEYYTRFEEAIEIIRNMKKQHNKLLDFLILKLDCDETKRILINRQKY